MIRKTVIGTILGVLLGASVVAQGPLTPFPNARGKTDANGYVMANSAAYTAPAGPLTNFANLRVRTDSNGYLMVTLGTVSSPFLAPDGTAAAPSYSFANATNKGLWNRGTDDLGVSIQGGAQNFSFNLNGFDVFNGGRLGLASSGTTANVFLVPDAANTLALRNGTNAQAMRIAGSDPSTTYRRLDLAATSTIAFVGSNWSSGAIDLGFGAGTGAAGASWKILASGQHFVAGTDNTYDIGASGATRPRNLYVGTAGVFGGSVTASDVLVGASGVVRVGSGGVFQANGNTNIASAGDFRLQNTGIIGWRNAANNANVTLTVTAADVMTASGTFAASAFTFNGTSGKTGATCTAFTVGGCTTAVEPLDYATNYLAPWLNDAGFVLLSRDEYADFQAMRQAWLRKH